jgi:hypothetical protein
MFNATIILLFCVIQNPSDPGNDALIQDAEYGRKMIQELTGRSLTATRCCALINVRVHHNYLTSGTIHGNAQSQSQGGSRKGQEAIKSIS